MLRINLSPLLLSHSIQQVKTQLESGPSVIVSTPSKCVEALTKYEEALNVKESLQMLIIDEADLILSYG
jgi:ATP-dependent RNA helicase DDX56/DBP9